VNNPIFSKKKNLKGFNLSRHESKPLNLDFFKTTNRKNSVILIINKLGLIFFFLKDYDHSSFIHFDKTLSKELISQTIGGNIFLQ
jgi:hypothetical protein